LYALHALHAHSYALNRILFVNRHGRKDKEQQQKTNVKNLSSQHTCCETEDAAEVDQHAGQPAH